MHVKAEEEFGKVRQKVEFCSKSVKSETPVRVSLVKFSVSFMGKTS